MRFQRVLICGLGACLPLAACGGASETRFQSALEEAGRLMTYSHDREATGRQLVDRNQASAACPNFRAAATRAEGATNVMQQAGHPDAAWADEHGWGKALAAALAQRDAMQLRTRQVCG
jgi:hypothetical protein